MSVSMGLRPRSTRGRARFRQSWRPAGAGGRRILAAVGIDSLGNGMLFAFQVLFLTVVVGLTLAQVGLALTTAQLVALPAPVLAGRLVDRIGPKIGSVVGDVLCAAGYAGLLVAHSLWVSVVSLSLIQIGISTYWTANGPLIALVAPAEHRVRWFGAVQAIRNAGIGIGGALAALAVAWSQRDGLRLLVLIDVLTYVLAAVLVLTWTAPAPHVLTAGAAAGDEDGDENGGDENGGAENGGVENTGVENTGVENGGAEDSDESGVESSGAENTGVENGGANTAVASMTPGGTAGPGPGGYRLVLRDWAFLRFLAVNLVFVLAALVPGLLVAVYLTEVLHRGSWLAGALLTLNTVMIVVLQTSVGRRIEPIPAGRILTAATVLNAVAFLVFAAVGLLPGAGVAAGLVLGMVVLTVAEMLSTPVTGALAVSFAPPALRGRYQALVQLTWTVGGLVAPALLVGLLQVEGRLPWVVLAALSLLTVLLTAGLRPEPRG